MSVGNPLSRVGAFGTVLLLSLACRDQAQGAQHAQGAEGASAAFGAEGGSPAQLADRQSVPIPGRVWIGRDELSGLPTAGAAWDAVRRDAARDPGAASIADQHSMHDIYTLAAALVCARTGEQCDRARSQLLSAVGTERGADWHSVARNLGAYIIAADLLGLRADGSESSTGTKVHRWIAGFLTRTDIRANAGEPVEGTRGIGPFHSGSNSAAQEGFVHVAAAAYLADSAALARGWDAFRTFVCDPGAPDRERIDLEKGTESGWAHDDDAPCAINPAGATRRVPGGRAGGGEVHRIDGAIINDMRRGGDYQWPPGWTQYPWVGLEGVVPAAVILHRAGYPAFEIADRAVLRTHEFLWSLREQTGRTEWFDGRRASEIVLLVNQVYGTSFPVAAPIGAGRLVGYTDWSHGRWRPAPARAAAP